MIGKPDGVRTETDVDPKVRMQTPGNGREMPDPSLPVVEELFIRHADGIKGFLFTLIGDAAVSDDLMQEVYLVVREKAGDFTPGTNFMAWVRAICRFKALHHFRSCRRRPLIDPEAAELLATADEQLSDEWSEHRIALARCLDRLGEAPRHLLHLRFAENLPPRAIANRLGRSVNGISVALSKSLAALRSCVGRLAGAPS